MTLPKSGKGKLGPKAAKAAQAAREKIAEGIDPEQAIESAHDDAYELKGNRKLISTYVGQNLKRPAFMAEISLTSDSVKAEFTSDVWAMFKGTHPKVPKESVTKAMMAAMKVMFPVFYQPKLVVSHEDAFAGKSIEELEYFQKNLRWPSGEELASYRASGSWPTVLEGRPTLQ